MNPEQEQQTAEIVAPSALEAISKAEINQAIATAKQYPRTLSTVKQGMLAFATLDTETAASCFYTLPRGGKNIQGPSVRLAEIAVSCYQNLRVATRVLHTVTTGDQPHVMVQAVAMDLQNNVSISIEKRRRITGKKSKGGVPDEDDINLACNAASAIAMRDAVFKVVPLALIKPVFEAAKKTAIGDAKTLADRRAGAIDAFGKMGITKERVLAKLEKRNIDDVGLEDLEILIGLFTAIKDGEVTVDEAFPANAPAAAAPVVPPANVPTGKAPEPAKPAATAPAAPPKQPASEPQAEKAPSAPPATQETQPASQPAPATGQSEAAPTAPATPAAPALTPMQQLGGLMQDAEVTPETLIAYCKKQSLMKKEQKTLSELAEAKIAVLVKNWNTILPEVKKFAAAPAA